MPRYKLTIEYDGTEFCGWQKQEPLAPEEGDPRASAHLLRHVEAGLVAGTPGRIALRTVQAVVERAVREIVREPVMVQGASRTDAGVHARGQVAAFTCSGDDAVGGEEDTCGTPPLPVPREEVGQVGAGGPPAPREKAEDLAADEVMTGTRHGGWPVSRGLDRLRRAINGRLPGDVQVVRVEHVEDSFDPIGDCTSKGYSYLLHVSPPPPFGSGLRAMWDRRFCLHVWHALDIDHMNEAARVLVGEHDFAAFAAAGHGRLTTVRTIYECKVVDATPTTGSDADESPWPRRLRVEVSGSGFLYNMVRIITGTLIEAGRGRLSPDDIRRALEAKDRRLVGPTSPPEGLCLEWVRYKDL
ncbi:MAG: tRNA pseudouridine synthase A [Phycisphaerales bacterium]|nr:MAG: tRNA pseudouridine synthase A [Phycisphaerales bacterium]